MSLGSKIHWGKADVASKIFGLYESEVLDIIEHKKYDSLINLGAADGYYPIGMLMHNMVKNAYCFEENPLGKKYINENAELNNIHSGISIYGRADKAFYKQLPENVTNENNLVLCDIEGGEFDDGKNKRQSLIERFQNFDVELVLSKPKQWSNIPEITSLNDNDQALVCSEGRRVLGEWLVAKPR